eukprot:COSAG03_NODE_2561_length_2647_cov_4.335397_1_plen_53_part_10
MTACVPGLCRRSGERRPNGSSARFPLGRGKMSHRKTSGFTWALDPGREALQKS